MTNLKPGVRVKILFVTEISQEEDSALKDLDYTVTVETVDLYGSFYSVEFPDYLFVEDNYLT